MKFYYVYILKCTDNSYYIGITNDVTRRVNEHNDGINLMCYTYNRRPVELVFSSKFNDVNQAIGFEKQLKGWSRKKKEAVINGNWNLLPELSKNKMKK